MSLSSQEKRALGEAGWRYKLQYGHWPKPSFVPLKKTRLVKHRGPNVRAELPRPERGEQKITVAEIRRRLTALKLERGCMDCGYRTHPAALDFDHARGVKSVNLSQISEKYWSVVAHEIEKCDVVCANCHRVRTTKRRGKQCMRS